MKRSIILLTLSFGLFFTSLFAPEKKVRVIDERAPIYAEASTDSYRIETVRKGTILTLFTSGESDATWFYVSYSSKRWNSQVTGFIQASMVEEVSDKPMPPPEKVKPPEIRENQVPEKREEIQPRKEIPEKAPEKATPKTELVTVKENMGVSSVPASKPYALPEFEWENIARTFLAIDTEPEATENIDKGAKPSPEVTKSIPQEKQERRPLEPQVVKPKTEEPKEEIAKKELEHEAINKEEIKKSETKQEGEPKDKRKEEKPTKNIPEKIVAETEQVVPRIAPKQPPRPKKPMLPGEPSLFTLSLGYGPSAGSGFGGFIQLNSKTGFSIHLGAGYYPTTYFYSEHAWAKNQVLYSAGIKYYIPLESERLRTFVDIQYGGVSVEAVRVITGFWHSQYVYENIQKTLYGPSLLLGIELRLLGNAGLNGAIGVSYNMTEWDYWERDYFLTGEVGLLIYLW